MGTADVVDGKVDGKVADIMVAGVNVWLMVTSYFFEFEATVV